MQHKDTTARQGWAPRRPEARGRPHHVEPPPHGSFEPQVCKKTKRPRFFCYNLRVFIKTENWQLSLTNSFSQVLGPSEQMMYFGNVVGVFPCVLWVPCVAHRCHEETINIGIYLVISFPRFWGKFD